MMRILLADHSPHAQRMAERILREEGYQVVSVTDGDTAMLRLKDVRPQMILADIGLKGFSGLKLCEYVKSTPEFAGIGVVLTVGALEVVDERATESAKADAVLRKPFEASALLDVAARFSKPAQGGPVDRTDAEESVQRPTRAVVVLDPDHVRAAVTVALDEAMEPLIERITDRVLNALAARR